MSVSRQAQEAERSILAVKKQQDVEKLQAQGLLALIQQASSSSQGTGDIGRRISVYA